jgi:hypothetical protein
MPMPALSALTSPFCASRSRWSPGQARSSGPVGLRSDCLVARLVHRHSRAVMRGKTAQRTAAQFQAQQAAAQPAAAPAPEDRMAKIKELGEMKSQGLLADEEFAAEKARS